LKALAAGGRRRSSAHKGATAMPGPWMAAATLETQFMAVAEKRLKSHPGAKAAGQLPVVRKQYHKAVDAAEAKIKDASKVLLKQIDRFKVAQKSVEELAKRVQLIKGFRGDAYRILDNALLATDLLLSPLSGNALVSGAANIAMNVAPLAATLAIDRITKVALEGTLRE
jgi:hypothetical protein